MSEAFNPSGYDTSSSSEARRAKALDLILSQFAGINESPEFAQVFDDPNTKDIKVAHERKFDGNSVTVRVGDGQYDHELIAGPNPVEKRKRNWTGEFYEVRSLRRLDSDVLEPPAENLNPDEEI